MRAGTLTIPMMVKKVAFYLDSGCHINFKKKNMSDPFEPYMNPELAGCITIIQSVQGHDALQCL